MGGSAGKEAVLEEIEVLFPLRKVPPNQFSTVLEAKQWLVAKELSMAKMAALRYLSRQSLASTLLMDKLLARGYSEKAAQGALNSCAHYISDEEYWPRLVERELMKGYGPRYIVWKWGAKGLPKNIVEAIATPERQKKAIQALSAKIKDRKKAFRKLMQRGFDSHILAEVLH